MVPPPAARSAGKRRADGLDRAEDGHVVLLAPPLRRDVLGGAVLRVPGVVDERVEASLEAEDLRDGPRRGAGLRHVEAQRPQAGLAGERLRPARGSEDPVAAPGGLPGHREADAARGPRDQNDLRTVHWPAMLSPERSGPSGRGRKLRRGSLV